MFNWWKRLLNKPQDDGLYKNITVFNFAEKEKEAPKAISERNISEPVISIVKTFKEKGRWKISGQMSPHSISLYGCSYSFSAEDTKTGEVYHIAAEYQQHCFSRVWSCCYKTFPTRLIPSSLPTWMTKAEKEYVIGAFEHQSKRVAERFKVVEDRQRSKGEKQAKVNQDKERNRLMSVYCKERQ